MANQQKKAVPEVSMDEAVDLYLRLLYPEGLPDDVDKETLKGNLKRKIAMDKPQWANRDGYVTEEEKRRRLSKEYTQVKAQIIEDANKEELPSDPNERYLFLRDKEARENAELKREEEKEDSKKVAIIDKAKEEKSERPQLDPQLMIKQMLAQKIKDYQKLQLNNDQQLDTNDNRSSASSKERLTVDSKSIEKTTSSPEKESKVTVSKKEQLEHRSEKENTASTESFLIKDQQKRNDSQMKLSQEQSSSKKEKEVRPISKDKKLDVSSSDHSKKQLSIDTTPATIKPRKKKLSFSERRQKRKREALQFSQEIKKRESHLKSTEEKQKEEKVELLKALNAKKRAGMKKREDLLLPRNEFGSSTSSRKDKLEINYSVNKSTRDSYFNLSTQDPTTKEDDSDQKRYAVLDMNVTNSDMDMGFSMEMEL